MLPIAMIIGTLGYRWIGEFAHLMPYILFVMLFVTFCKLSPREMRLSPAHFWLLLIQLIGGGVVYLTLRSFDPVVAQGALICVLAPTAISAAVITGMLGGSVAFLTSYILFSNVAVAICAPLIFPLISDHTQKPFLESVFHICSEVGPLLLVPLILAWIVRYGIPSLHRQILKVQSLSFYLWSVALTVVTGRTVKFLVEQESPDYTVEIGCAVAALVICVCQFVIGRRIGKHYGDPISSGQGLGQKNTILAIWMAQTYLNPISSIAPASYILWQNVINSYQLWLKNKRSETTK
jgi:Predicted Na+-dependent transporter